MVTPKKKSRTPRKPAGVPTEDQIRLARTVALRHRLTLPEGFTTDLAWTQKFLDCFAYDTDQNTGGLRRVSLLQHWCQEGRDILDMATKLEMLVMDVAFMISLMRDSGHRLSPVIDSDRPMDLLYERLALREERQPLDLAEPPVTDTDGEPWGSDPDGPRYAA